MKGEIIFYDYEFNRLGRGTRFTDIYHKELYNGIGTFEAGISMDDAIAEKLADRDYTVAVWGEAQAVITSTQYSHGEGVLKLYGRTPNWMLSRRACPKFGQRKNTPHALAHALVDEVWGDSIVTGMGKDITAEEITFWRNVYNPLSEVVADCLDRCGGGHRVVYDTKAKQWRFETFEGKDLSRIFSADRRNLFDITETRSVLDYFNGGFYVKDDEAETWVEIPSDSEGIYRWTSRLDGSGESSARSDLAKRKIQDTMDFKLTANTAANVGDKVKVQSRRGNSRKTRTMRVTAVERWAEKGDIGQRPILEEI